MACAGAAPERTRFMSLFSEIFNLVASIIAPSAAPTTAGSATTLFDIGKLPITVGELKAGVATLKKFPLDAVEQAIADHFANLQEDAVVAEDFAGALAAIGVPFAGDVDLAIMTLAWITAHGEAPAASAAASNLKPPPNGGVLGAFLDSLRGIKRPVVVE
jgi:hypothetical protein